MPVLAPKRTTYRVGTSGNTGKAVGAISKEFGVDIGKWGNMSDEELRKLAEHAKWMEKQKKMVDMALKHLEKIVECKEAIEKARAEAVKLGLKTKEAIDRHVLEAVLATHKHEKHIQELAQKLQHGMQLIDRESQSSMRLEQNSFQNRLRMVGHKFNAAIADQNSGFRAQLSSIRNSKNDAADKQRWIDYVTAKDYSPYRGGGGWGGRLMSAFFR